MQVYKYSTFNELFYFGTQLTYSFDKWSRKFLNKYS